MPLEILKRKNRGSIAWLIVVDALLLGRIVLRDRYDRVHCMMAIDAILLCSPPRTMLAKEAHILRIAATTRGGRYGWYPLSIRTTLANLRKPQPGLRIPP